MVSFLVFSKIYIFVMLNLFIPVDCRTWLFIIVAIYISILLHVHRLLQIIRSKKCSIGAPSRDYDSIGE